MKFEPPRQMQNQEDDPGQHHAQKPLRQTDRRPDGRSHQQGGRRRNPFLLLTTRQDQRRQPSDPERS